MLKTVAEVSALIENKQWLHIAGSENLLRQLPKGNWTGGTVEYFMCEEGGVTTDEKLFVYEMLFPEIKIAIYDENNIENIASDGYDNGFSLVVMPIFSKVADVFALNAPGFKDNFIKNVVGWVSVFNLSKAGQPGQTPLAVNGRDLKYYTDKAVVMHIMLPPGQIANIGIVNIFSANENSPVIEFSEDSVLQEKCLLDGREIKFTEYLADNGIDTKVPLVGEFYAAEINTSFYIVDYEKGTVQFSAPVFKGIKYRFANPVKDYPAAFNRALEKFRGEKAVFSCNCALNHLYGDLEGKRLDCFFGPCTGGEIAYQLLNQTLVYLTIKDMGSF